ncbi:MAG: type II secretion system secretin GspD [Candidatus Rokubacteria bacterium]|nr:type II secretion system secretin GspD [Candidatus Rokubacteria bacterium]
MTRHPPGIWLSGLLMLSLVGCAILSPPKPPAPTPKVEVTVEAPKPPEPTAPPPAAVQPAPPAAEAKKEVPVAQAPSAPAQPPAPRPPAAPPSPPAPAAQRGRFVVLNFDNADIEVIIHAASEIVGFNYVLAPDVRGKVTVQTSVRIPQEEVFNVLLAILEVHGFTAVKSDTLYKIIKLEGARERPVPTIVGAVPDPGRVGDEIITQIVPIRFASVAELSALLRPLMSARGSLIPHRETNLLIITDSASNIRRLLDIVKLVDVEVALEELQVIPLRFADAQEIAQILNQIFAAARRPAAVPVALPAPPPPGVPPGAPRPPTDGAAERPPLIVAYRGINVLIVHARKTELEIIRRLLNQLDVDIYGGRRIFIYYAENTKAKDLAATMNSIYGRADGAPPAAPRPPAPPGAPPPPLPRPPGAAAPTGVAEGGLVEGEVRFIADDATNAVIVTTFPRNWPEIEQTLKKLDRMPRQVLIEVLVAEITLTDDIRLGIEWAIRSGRFDVSQAPTTPGSGSVTTTLGFRPTFPIPSLSPIGGIAQGLNFFTFGTNDFFTALNALAVDNKVNVLSSPSILTTENKKAVINVSDSIPVITSQQVPLAGATTTTPTTPTAIATQTVEYKDAGVILTVTPRIGERGTVALDIKQDVNDVGAQEPPTFSRRFIKREVETSVVLTNNQTLALGGLIKNKRTLSRTGIPLLNRIPLLGLLFGTTQERIDKTELLILITPRVLGTALDAARLTEEMKRITPGIRDAVQQAPRPPSPPPRPPSQ